MTLVIKNECRKPLPYEREGRRCELGTYGCAQKHRAYEDGTSCRYCKTDGGHWICPESDRGIFCCSNYAGAGEHDARQP